MIGSLPLASYRISTTEQLGPLLRPVNIFKTICFYTFDTLAKCNTSKIQCQGHFRWWRFSFNAIATYATREKQETSEKRSGDHTTKAWSMHHTHISIIHFSWLFIRALETTTSTSPRSQNLLISKLFNNTPCSNPHQSANLPSIKNWNSIHHFSRVLNCNSHVQDVPFLQAAYLRWNLFTDA